MCPSHLFTKGSEGVAAQTRNRKQIDVVVGGRMENRGPVKMLIDCKSSLTGDLRLLGTGSRAIEGGLDVDRQLAPALAYLCV